MSKNIVRKIFGSKSVILLIVTVCIVLFFYILNPNYLGPDNIKGFFTSISLPGTLAVGLACLMISGNMDLSAAAVSTVSGIIAAMILRAGAPWYVGLLGAIAFGALTGAFVSFLVNVIGLMSFIATIGMSSVYNGLSLILSKGENIAIGDKTFIKLGNAIVAGVPLPFIILVVLFVVYGIILSNTRFGRMVYMCGGNRGALRLAGVNPKRIVTALFINSGAIAGLAGAIVAARLNTGSPRAATGVDMSAISAIILGGVSFMGGTGTMSGAFIGLLLINSFNNGLQAVGLQAYWHSVAKGLLLIVALLFDYFSTVSTEKSMKAEIRKTKFKEV